MTDLSVAYPDADASLISVVRHSYPLALADRIDGLATMRAESVRRLHCEAVLAREIVAAMRALGVSCVETTRTVATLSAADEVVLAPRPPRVRCACCAGTIEPLLAFEMAPGERGDYDVCRACMAGLADEEAA
jgi:hypothetical protein